MILRLFPWLLATLIPAQALAQPCVDYKEAIEVGRLEDATLNELSGLARASSGGFWAHNDSGDTARIFKVGPDGKALGTWDLVGIDAVDFEDMANAPCADGGSCLVVADIGNNTKRRDIVFLHRFAEPTTTDAIAEIETTSFKYPDGNHDAEAVFATAEAAYVINKDGIESRLYRVPWTPVGVVTAELITTFAEPVTVTAADLSDDGTRLLVRGYLSIAEFDVSVSFVTGLITPKYVPSSFEGQAEAITYRSSGGGFVTISEAPNARVNLYTCAEPEPEPDAGVEPEPDAGTEPEPDVDAGADVDPVDVGQTPDTPKPATESDDSCAGFLPIWLLPLFLCRRR